MTKKRVTPNDQKIAAELWTHSILPIGSDERRLVSAFIAHPHAQVSDDQIVQLWQLWRKQIR